MSARQGLGQKPYLHSLDLLRGFAALCVCLYHTGFLLTGGFHLLPGGYLCVDLFFLLSGFVIARTYDPRMAEGMTISSFCVQRLARLYPLFFATTLFGFLVAAAWLYNHTHDFDFERLLPTLAGNLLLIPNFSSPYGINSTFPFNGATWSIFFEFYANVAFVLFWPLLNMRRLMIITGVSAMLLAIAAAQAHSLDIGAKTYELVLAIPRVVFSFSLGVIISRLHRRESTVSGLWPSLVGLGVILIAISLRDAVPSADVWFLDICIVLFAFPLVLLGFVQLRFSGRHAAVSAFLGNISYSVYLLQTPLLIFYCGLPEIFLQRKIETLTPWAGMLFVPVLVIASYLVWSYFELPAKRRIRQWHRSITSVLRGLA